MGSTRFRNSLEPPSLIQAFVEYPPENFESRISPSGMISFLTKFDLTTTLTPNLRRLISFLIRFLPRPLTLFVGTPVTEYVPLPPSASATVLVREMTSFFAQSKAAILICKDLPQNSPLLNDEDNQFCHDLVDGLRAQGFTLVEGEALAYVPIDFASIDDFMKRFSRSRRKDYRRKLRSREDLRIECAATGTAFANDAFCAHLYELYLNVYADSDVHFDKLTAKFFLKILRDERTAGRVFIYSVGDKIIGFNLCYVVDRVLIDKYIGFDYAMSHQHNLYFVSWFHNLEFCLQNDLRFFVAGWTDPEIKRDLGAAMTYTHHAVYFRYRILRWLLNRFKTLFEADRILLRESNIQPS